MNRTERVGPLAVSCRDVDCVNCVTKVNTDTELRAEVLFEQLSGQKQNLDWMFSCCGSAPVCFWLLCVLVSERSHTQQLLPPLYSAGCGFHLLFFLRPLVQPAFPALEEGFTGRDDDDDDDECLVLLLTHFYLN